MVRIRGKQGNVSEQLRGSSCLQGSNSLPPSLNESGEREQDPPAASVRACVCSGTLSAEALGTWVKAPGLSLHIWASSEKNKKNCN